MWSAAEDIALRRAVSQHGCEWARIASSGAVSGRTSGALKKRWARLDHGVVRDIPAGMVLAQPALNCAALPSVAMPPPVCASVRYDRDRVRHRPWDFHVVRSHVATRAPTSRQSSLLSNLGLLSSVGPTVLCNLQRAETELRNHYRKAGIEDVNAHLLAAPVSEALARDLGLFYHPGDPCHTMTSANSNLYWVVLTGIRAEFLSSPEIAAFMGQPRNGVVLRAMGVVKSPYLLNGYLAESVHRCMADHCAEVVSTLAGLETIGSFYSGAFDALGGAFTHGEHPLRRVYAVEREPDKASVLSLIGSYSVIYADAAVACMVCPYTDVICFSPPCIEVSTARRYTELDRANVPLEAVSEYLNTILTAISRVRPRAFVVEQSSGLRSHFAPLYDSMHLRLCSLGYTVHHSCVDAHESYGVSHHRSRLIWVGLL